MSGGVTQKILDWLRDEGPLPQHIVRYRLKARKIPPELVSAALRRLRNMDLIRAVRKPTALFYATPRLPSDPTEALEDLPLPQTPPRRKSGPIVPPPPPWIHPIRRRALGMPEFGPARPENKQAKPVLDYSNPLLRHK